MKYYLCIFTLVVLSFSAAYGDEIRYTPFEIIFSPENFDKQGPNHQILILNKNESASIPITIRNNDSVPHEISLTIPKMQDVSYFLQDYSFEPQLITILPESEKQVKLNLTIKNDTDSQWGMVHILAQSNSFGATGKYFYIAIGDKDIELDPFIDHSMRSGLPGAAFPNLYSFNSKYAELLALLDEATPNNLGVPRYVPKGYSFQGLANFAGNYPFLVFAKTPTTNMTESTEFIQKGGIMVYYGVDGINVNRTDWISLYVAQEEGQQILVNGLIGTASERQERVVVYDEARYMFPAELNLSDGHYSNVGFRGNIPLEELVKMAASLPSAGKTESPIVISKVELYGSSSFFTKNVKLCFEDLDTLGPWAVGWIEIQNQGEHTVSTQGDFSVKTAHWERGWSHPSLVLESGEKCTIQTHDKISTRKGVGGSEGNDPPAGYWGSSTRIGYFIGDELFVNQTPDLSDTYGDTRVWQITNDKWEFGSSPFADWSDIRNLPREELQKISPLKQFKVGIHADKIVCKEGLRLILHPITEIPVCVKAKTEQTLVSRGWYYPVPFDNTQDDLPNMYSEELITKENVE